MKKNCGIIRDLLPLYAENICSDTSRNAVTEHLADCTECRDELKKINTGIVIKADADISAFKKIKKRSRVQKIIISTFAALVGTFVAGIGLWFLQFYLINTDCSMDYEKFNLSENVWVDEDENGDLWICRKESAASSIFTYPTLSDANGKHFPEEGFDKNTRRGYGFTLKQRKIEKFSIINYPAKEERTLICNKKEKDYEYIFYYDDKNNTEYVLWERE